MLKVSDMPAGWRATESESTALEYYDDIDQCTNYARAVRRSRKLPRAEAEFEQRDAQVSNLVVIYPKVSGATGAFDVASGPDVAPCLEEALKQIFRDSLRSDPRAGSIDDLDVEVGQLSIEPAGDESIGYQAKITVGADGVELELYGDVQFVRVGRALANFNFFDELIPLAGTDDFVAPVVRRLGSVG